ncbi:MAG: hypothetical protein N2Z65_00205 [Clostridiales bacterium]|nr:hypothetical protein [Clostridiales bacterium]
MTFFDDLGRKLGVVAETTMTKAKELTDITKLNMQISSEERKMEKLYSEIGKLVFDKEKDLPQSFVAEQCSKIVEVQKSIKELNKKLEEVKDQ